MTSAIASPSAQSTTLVTAGGNGVRTRGGDAVGSAFSSTLAQVQQGTAPQSLLPSNQKTETAAPVKIARSYRMADADEATRVQEAKGLDFDDVVDLMNPLQHIPVVGSIYRALTGDEIRPDVKAVGGFLLGAATGGIMLAGASSVITSAFESTTGEEPAVQVASAIFGDDKAQKPAEAQPVQVASAEPLPDIAPTPSAAQSEQVTPAPLTATPAAASKTATVEKQIPPRMAALMSTPGQMRVGNTIYTGPQMKMAAKAAVSPSAVSPAAETPSAPAAVEAASDKTQLDSQTLGALMQQQAQTREQGGALPPELVRDMMVMALDKYKAAQAQTGAQAQ